MLIAKGMSNMEIAEMLFLSEATVKTHVGRILAKLGEPWCWPTKPAWPAPALREAPGGEPVAEVGAGAVDVGEAVLVHEGPGRQGLAGEPGHLKVDG